MTPDAIPAADRFARVREAFHRLIEIDLSERAEALQMLAETDPIVAAELRTLLGQFDETDLLAAPEKAPPSRLGPFRLLHRIGRGGMGDVFLAERVDGGFEQQVALKLVRETVLSPELARRFLRERQILARLQHPNIAHIVDGGVAPDERPWLAMEYVPGERITRWCVARSLGAEDCVRLFLPVCDAVQFAHRNLIVHRDLKPANIQVDAEGRPRLLDFGIARLLDAQDVEQTRSVAALTPAYAAPEQREGGEITTATDIYQLGVVLREMVTGQRGNSTDRVMRGDLGRILAKATALIPSQRYAGVAMFADDLSDWLQRRPLRSGIGSRRERLRKTLWQWRWPLAMLVVVLLAVGAGAMLAWLQAREKAREAEVAQQTTQFLINLFRGADPTVARGAALTAQDLLDQGTARLRGLALAPEVRARLLHTVAETYTALGLYEHALAPAMEALDARRGADRSIEHAESLDQVGNILRLRAEFAQAEPLLREALHQRRALLPRDDPAAIESIAHLAALESAKGRFMEANVLFAEAVEAARRRFGDESAETAHYLDSHAGNLDDMGQRNEALSLYRQALAIRERKLGPDDAEVATTLVSLGVHLSGSRRFDEAAELLQRALGVRTRIYGADHPLVAYARIALAGVYADQGRLEEAEPLVQQALSSLRGGLLPDHPKVSEALNMLALIRIMRRDYLGAIPLQQEVLDRYATTLGEDHPDALTAKNNLAYALIRDGRAPEAERLLRDVLARRRDDNGQAEAHAHQNLASALGLQGRFTEAVEAQRKALQVQIAREGPASAATAIALRELAIAEESAGAGNEERYRAALAMAGQEGTSPDPALDRWTVPLASFLVGRGRCADALPLLRTALRTMESANVADDPIAPSQAKLLLAACDPDASRSGAEGLADHCRSLAAIPGMEVDVYPTTRELLRTRCVNEGRN